MYSFSTHFSTPDLFGTGYENGMYMYVQVDKFSRILTAVTKFQLAASNSRLPRKPRPRPSAIRRAAAGGGGRRSARAAARIDVLVKR